MNTTYKSTPRKLSLSGRLENQCARKTSKSWSFLPLVRLKQDEFTWGGGAEQQEALKKIKEYLMSPPVLRAPKAGNPFKMYIVAQEWVIGAVLLQEEDGK
jgi:hypothetical protein